jgi:hypothetical protein
MGELVPGGPGGAVADLTAQLLAPLHSNEQHAIDLIASRIGGGGWPIFDFVDGEFERDDIDAPEVLDGLPTLRGIGEYPLVWCSRPPNGRPMPTERIGLTVLGLHHAQSSEPAKATVFAFLAFLPRLAALRTAQPGNPE